MTLRKSTTKNLKRWF